MSGDAFAAVMPAPTGSMVPRRHRVAWRRVETPDTVTFALDPVDDPSQPFQPGQFNMLYAFGIGESAISISGETDAGSVLHTVRSVGAVTAALCEAPEGSVIGLRGPFGTDWGVDGATGRDVVVVGGGIGLAPLRPAIRTLLANRDRYRRVSVLLGARSPQDLIYSDEIASWRRHGDVEVETTVDHAGDGWPGHVGVVTELIPSHLDSEALALVCGPEVMIRFAARALVDRGIPPEQVRVSLERNMKCAVGHCGHCQFGPDFVCYGGPVFPYAKVARLMSLREV